MSIFKKDSVYSQPFKVRIMNYLSVQAVPLAVFAIIVIIASLLSPVFFSSRNLENLTLQVAVNMISSMGMFMVLLTGGIDLSIGSCIAASGVLAAGFLAHMPLFPALLLAITAGLLLGTVNGLLVNLNIPPFIVTLGMLLFARGIAYWYTGAVPILLTRYENMDLYLFIGGGRLFNLIPFPAILWLVIVLVTSFITRRTSFGRITYAIGGNENAVRLSGINVAFYKVLPYAYSGICAGIAGVLLTARLGVGSPASGDGQELDCVAATVIGGTALTGGVGSVSGVVIGVFIFGIISNILNLLNVSSYPQQMLKGTIIVVAVIASSRRGLIKKFSLKKKERKIGKV